ncbi:putative O-methyltransferase [Xylariaceae sp. FL0016]|nr:putative O-methyltransferase [Xylariaceae sp. FL0016]
MPGSEVTDLLKELATLEPQTATAKGRQYALTVARSLVHALETPGERISRLAWYDPLLIAAVRLAIDIKVFAVLKDAAGSAKTCDELAQSTKCDSVLLSRLLKQLATGNIVKEVDADTYSSTPVSDVLATPTGAGPVVDCFTTVAKINSGALQYFRDRSFANPVDKEDSMWMAASGTKQHYFDWIFQSGGPEAIDGFLKHMEFKTLETKWYEAAPVKDILGTQCGGSDVLIVDVGGNTGYDVLGFQKAHADIPGRLIVQDMPKAIEAINSDDIKPVEPMTHDFFMEQPVKGAKAYYMKMVLHDWPDAACQDILSKLKPALKPGYSKILINEVVVPEQGATWFEAGVDLLMMWVHSGRERREGDWRALIEGAGLKLVNIWSCGQAPEKLIEVELP